MFNSMLANLVHTMEEKNKGNVNLMKKKHDLHQKVISCGDLYSEIKPGHVTT